MNIEFEDWCYGFSFNRKSRLSNDIEGSTLYVWIRSKMFNLLTEVPLQIDNFKIFMYQLDGFAEKYMKFKHEITAKLEKEKYEYDPFNENTPYDPLGTFDILEIYLTEEDKLYLELGGK